MAKIDAFASLRRIAELAADGGSEDDARESLVRYLSESKSDDPDPYQPVVNALLSQLGLFPYVVGNPSGTAEQLGLAYHVPPKHPNSKFVFHSEQKRVFDRLVDGHNVVLSAPTSFGKSAILDAVVASERWATIAVIVPTNALIDETRRRVRALRSSHQIITHPTQTAGSRCIWILTQERFLELGELPVVELFVVDEFYKLQPKGDDDHRAALLNMAWARPRATAAQYYLIGPNIQSLAPALDDDLKHELVVSGFKTVVVDVEDRSKAKNRKADLLKLAASLEGSALVFASGPAKARTVAGWLAESKAFERKGRAADAADWLAKTYDPEWELKGALLRGVGLHYGPLPRSVQRIMVRLFNEGSIQLLVCTSTLIEGVNTAAESVIIFDKSIDNQTLDFFTFSNIRGRAGRMFRHFVGRVYSYMEPPDPEDVEVDIPIETQSRLASLAALVQLDPEDLTAEAQERLRPIFAQDKLSIEAIRSNRGLDPELQIALATTLRSMPDSSLRQFSWSGVPGGGQVKAVLELAYNHLISPRTRLYTNFESLWARLQVARTSPEDFTLAVDSQQPHSKSRSKAVDDVLDFRRKWMTFEFPSLLRSSEVIIGEVLSERGLKVPDYSYIVGQIEGQYLPAFFVDLEDYGLPVPLALRLQQYGLAGDSLDDLLRSLEAVAGDEAVRSHFSKFELWIIDDVLIGL